MSASEPTVRCLVCGAENEVPPEATVLGRFRCHECQAVNEIATAVYAQPLLPGEQPEDDNTPTDYNMAVNTQRADIRDGNITCGIVAAAAMVMLSAAVALVVIL